MGGMQRAGPAGTASRARGQTGAIGRASSLRQAAGRQQAAGPKAGKQSGARPENSAEDPTIPDGSRARLRELDGRQRPARSWRPDFLASLQLCPNIRIACEAAGIHRSTYYDNRKRDPEFEAAVQEALKEGVELLHAVCWQRAVNGVAKPVFQGGLLVGYVVEYSDRMAEMLLRAHGQQAGDTGAQFTEFPVTTNQTVVTSTPAQILERVKKLSPLMKQLAGQAIRPGGQPVNPHVQT